MSSKEAGKVISYRLPEGLVARLSESADKVNMSPGAYARLHLIEVLSDTERVRLKDELAEIRKGLTSLQRSLEIAVTALLVDAGKAALEEAQAFVREQMAGSS